MGNVFATVAYSAEVPAMLVMPSYAVQVTCACLVAGLVEPLQHSQLGPGAFAVPGTTVARVGLHLCIVLLRPSLVTGSTS